MPYRSTSDLTHRSLQVDLCRPTGCKAGSARYLPNQISYLDLCKPVPVTKPPSRTSRTALRRPIRFLLRRPNRRQDRRSLRRSFPENLITCIVTLIPHVTHHVQSSRDSRLSRFHEVSELLSQPPPVSIRKTYSPTHNSRAAQ